MNAPLRLVPPAGEVPDDRAAVARALLDRCFPLLPGVSDHISHAQRGELAEYDELQNDPKYLIGRLSQALTALLDPAADVPPLDASAELLAQAVGDAIKYRLRRCRECTDEAPCAACVEHCHQAGLYENLWRELGLIENLPPLRAQLKAAGR